MLVNNSYQDKICVILIYKRFINIIDVQTCLIHKEFKSSEELQLFKHIYISFLDYGKCQCICSTRSTFKISLTVDYNKKQFQHHLDFLYYSQKLKYTKKSQKCLTDKTGHYIFEYILLQHGLPSYIKPPTVCTQC